jgi:transcriptional regulator GlxA family with amidase domain
VSERINTGIFLFDGVEVLDFAGPYEVFSRTRTTPGPESRRSDDSAPFRVFTAAERAEPVTATGGLRIIPDFDFQSAPLIDMLIVPGGFGTRPLLHNPEVCSWIRSVAGSACRVASVCTGSLLLAQAGLLSGLHATTHWAALDLLAAIDPSVIVERHRRFVKDGIATSAGVAAGIDMVFSIVEEICGAAVAAETARYIEYEFRGSEL